MVATVRGLVERQVPWAVRLLAEVLGAEAPKLNAERVSALCDDAHEALEAFIIDEYEPDLLDYISARDIALFAVALYRERDGGDGEWLEAARRILFRRYDRLASQGD